MKLIGQVLRIIGFLHGHAVKLTAKGDHGAGAAGAENADNARDAV